MSLRLQEKVSDLSFCVLDLDNSNEMDCNDGDNFIVRVDRGVSERAMKKAREEVVDLMRSEQGIVGGEGGGGGDGGEGGRRAN